MNILQAVRNHFFPPSPETVNLMKTMAAYEASMNINRPKAETLRIGFESYDVPAAPEVAQNAAAWLEARGIK